MIFTSAKDPSWADQDKTRIDLIVSFQGIGEVPFTASQFDSESHGRLLWENAIAGEYGVISPFTPPSVPEQVPSSLQDYEQALDAHLDSVAASDRWRDRFTFVARAAYPNPWQKKAIAFGVWMDTCNVMAYSHMQAVLEGTEQLVPIADFIAALPVFTFVEDQP